MYTRKQFGIELKERVANKQQVQCIGEWAYSMYLVHIEDVDLDFREVLLTLTTMELGPEFSFSHEELNKIADDLIAGKDVHL